MHRFTSYMQLATISQGLVAPSVETRARRLLGRRSQPNEAHGLEHGLLEALGHGIQSRQRPIHLLNHPELVLLLQLIGTDALKSLSVLLDSFLVGLGPIDVKRSVSEPETQGAVMLQVLGWLKCNASDHALLIREAKTCLG